MKKIHLRSTLLLIIAVVAAFVVLTLAGCSNSYEFPYGNSEGIRYGNGEDDEIVDGDDEEDDDDDESLGDGIDIELISDGETDFTIVISDLATEPEANAALAVKNAFKDRLGIDIDIKNETEFRLLDNGEDEKSGKIAIGVLTEDYTSVSLEKPLRDGEYILKVFDGSLYIVGGTDAATVSGTTYFINNYIKEDTESIFLKSGVVHKKITSASIGNMTVASSEIWKYRIVYYDNAVTKECAFKIRDTIASLVGYTLPICTDAEEPVLYEILVGKTNRTESIARREKYNRPNVYYDIETVGKKLVIMGEGYKTLNTVTELFAGHLSTVGGFGAAFDGSVKSGSVIDITDSELGVNMITRADKTDIRVMHWNMAAPYLNAETKVYTDNKLRGEVMADAILQVYPDIFTTNEFYKSHNGDTTLYDAVMGELSEYYNILESPYEQDRPEEGADVLDGKTVNSNILYRNNIGFTVLDSGWRYSSERTDATETNPEGWIYYHGSHTAVFKTYYGDRFVVSVAHYADSRDSSQWAQEHLAAVNEAIERNALASDVRVILTGDMYTSYSSESDESGYKYITADGYVDSQREAELNANDNVLHGTFHDIGVRQTDRISEDFIWTKNALKALKFKVLTFREVEDTSDHYPVVADLKLG